MSQPLSSYIMKIKQIFSELPVCAKHFLLFNPLKPCEVDIILILHMRKQSLESKAICWRPLHELTVLASWEVQHIHS